MDTNKTGSLNKEKIVKFMREHC